MDARREIVDGLTEEEVRECMLQMLADDGEHRRIEHPEWGTRPREKMLRHLLVSGSEGTEGRELLLGVLEVRDEHIRAHHPQPEEARDPPDSYIRSLVERVRSRHQPPDKPSPE